MEMFGKRLPGIARFGMEGGTLRDRSLMEMSLIRARFLVAGFWFLVLVSLLGRKGK
jgi:hypothetical protein